MLIETERSPYAKASQLPAANVSWTGGLWKERFDTCAGVTVPHIRKLFEDTDSWFHVVENFRIAAGLVKGEHAGTPFGDGDFYKWMEAAAYAAVKTGDKKLEAELDDYIELIGKCQQSDGYLSTKQIIGTMNGTGLGRLGDINDFEVYNFGHLFTAACVWKRLTGKDNFLKIAEKAAVYLKNMYEEAAATGEVQTAVCPSHYMGLIELYRTTGDRRWLDTAKLSIDLRDKVKNGTDDNQDRIPLRDHKTIVGHGVRSTYLYAGVADLYMENGDESLVEVLDNVWSNCVHKKLYINGGCGALYQGASPYGTFFGTAKTHQAFGYEYQLPNITAYNETCATLGNIFWNLRMFAVWPEAKYFDVIERSMLNLTLASVSLSGDKYFYENMLRRTKGLDYDLIWPLERKSELMCFCCPPNMARTIAQSSEYAYMVSGDAVWTGMYGASEAKVELACGASFTLHQETDYPWNGTIRFSFSDVTGTSPFALNIRIPGWASKGSILRGGKELKTIGRADSGTYFTVIVENPASDVIEVRLDMTPRLTVSNAKVEENTNQVAVERGPLVYCVETPDADVETLDDLFLPTDAVFREKETVVDGSRVVGLETEFAVANYSGLDRDALYQDNAVNGFRKATVNLVPYYAWDNRGVGEMKIWLPILYRF